MNPDTSDNDEIEEQSQLSESPFHGFHTWICEVGNPKSPDGRGDFTDFTDFTPDERGVYVAGAPARARTRARRHTPLPFSRCEIREIREIARRRGAKSGRFSPPGVKGVKSPSDSLTEVIL